MMRTVTLAHEADFEGWRGRARGLLAACTPPGEVSWSIANAPADLFAAASEAEEPVQPPIGETAARVPRAFLSLAADVVQHRDPLRFDLLYRLLWRQAHGERALLAVSIDPDVSRAEALAKAVRRDTHKMRAFLRFREIAPMPDGEDEPCFIAWFEPDHHIVEANAPFFVRRFANMCWSILTPARSAHWDRRDLRFGPGARRSDVPTEDALEEHWRAYYTSIFNPARLRVAAMRSEMPKKYWKNLPEAQLIEPLIRAAQRRTEVMIAQGGTEPARKGRVQIPPAADPMPVDDGIPTTLDGLRRQAAVCRACPLWAPATRTVFGEGAMTGEEEVGTPLMLVGEQPGDQEDLEGRPFVGPAGRMLDRALAEAGIDRRRAYVTNAVKHFKFLPRGKRRIHQKPDSGEIDACRHWLTHEIDLVKPQLIVAMGATAALSLLRRPVKIAETRGRVMPLDEARRILVTVHPSYLLRLPDELAKRVEYGRFVEDLRLAGVALAA